MAQGEIPTYLKETDSTQLEETSSNITKRTEVIKLLRKGIPYSTPEEAIEEARTLNIARIRAHQAATL